MDRDNGVGAASQLVMLTALLSLASMVGSILFRTQLLGLLFGRVEADVMDACVTYLVISALSFPALAVYNSVSSLFRSMNKTRAIMNVSIAMNCINVVGNAVGIFVLHAGVAGVAVPSLISRTFAAVVMLALAFRQDNTLYLRLRQVFAWDGGMVRRILSIAIPSSVEAGPLPTASFPVMATGSLALMTP